MGAAVRHPTELTLAHLQMGVHEEELFWLEKRVNAIKDASGSRSTTHHMEAKATPRMPHVDAAGDSDGSVHVCAETCTADLTKVNMT